LRFVANLLGYRATWGSAGTDIAGPRSARHRAHAFGLSEGQILRRSIWSSFIAGPEDRRTTDRELERSAIVL
jgi:hypothetical protein